MRILFLAPDVPWPTTYAGRQRSYALLRALSQRHEVTLSAPATPDEQSECFEGLKHLIVGFIPVPWEMHVRAQWMFASCPGRLRRLGRFARDLLTNPIPLAFRFITNDYRSLIARHRPGFDAVFCRYLYMLPVARDFPRRSIVVDLDDLHYLGLAREAWNLGSWGSFLLMSESARSYCYEQRSYRQLARVLVCSGSDFSRVRCHRKSVVRNGVDLPDPARLRTPPRPKTIIFVGRMAYNANVEGLRWFLSEVWPPLRQIVPEARLMVVGREANLERLPFARARRRARGRGRGDSELVFLGDPIGGPAAVWPGDPDQDHRVAGVRPPCRLNAHRCGRPRGY